MMSMVLWVEGANNFGATSSDNGGFIYTNKVWVRAVPSRVKDGGEWRERTQIEIFGSLSV
jgi:hypothetical protein